MSLNPPGEPGRSKKKSLSRRRVWLFRLIALSFPLVVLATLEVGLRVAGTGYPTSFLVPHPTKAGYLVDNYKFAWRFFPKALARAPRPIVVQESKPANTFRVVVFGGSAAMGDPEPAYGMPRMLDVLLSDRCPDKKIEVINCAVTAINSHVVRDIARDCRRLDADAWIVYLGNNEVHGPFGAGTVFGSRDRPLWLNRLSLALQRTKIGQALSTMQAGSANGSPKKWGGMEMFLEQKIRHDDPRLERVYANFEANLKAICKQRGSQTQLLISTVATNVKDFPPFVSMHGANRSGVPESAGWNEQFVRACNLQDAGRYKEAVTAFEKLEKTSSGFAELQFRLGHCLLADGQREAAMAKFKAARDLDGLRFRADSRINKIIASIALSQEAIFVDADKTLATQSPDGLVGDNFLHEHVHLNLAGNYALARELAENLVANCLSLGTEGLADEQASGKQASGEKTDAWLSLAECGAALGASPFHDRLTLQDVRGRLRVPPFNTQLGHADRDARLTSEIAALSRQMTPAVGQQTKERLQTLIAKRPDDWLLRQQLALLLDSMGDRQGAADQYGKIAAELPQNAESQFRWGAQLNRLKKRVEAEVALRKAIELRPDFVRAYNSLGICLSHQQRFEECYRQFRRAVELQPTFAEAYVNWGLVLANQGDAVAAQQKYRLATEADENYVSGHAQLGKCYVSANNYQDAMPHYEAVARLLPSDIPAQLNLGMLYLKFGGHAEQAAKQFRKTLQLDPSNELAKRGLAQLATP